MDRNLNILATMLSLPPRSSAVSAPGANDVGASRGHIMDAVEASLRRLQTDHSGLYQIQGNDPGTSIEETLRALDCGCTYCSSARVSRA
jgi:aryl-alcohol dehydrogenase-like predicted oxidoreductase